MRQGLRDELDRLRAVGCNLAAEVIEQGESACLAVLTEEEACRGTILATTLFQCGVCVPAEWNDEQVVAYAGMDCPAGTENGWRVHTSGPDPVRVPCQEKEGFVHLVLDA